MENEKAGDLNKAVKSIKRNNQVHPWPRPEVHGVNFYLQFAYATVGLLFPG